MELREMKSIVALAECGSIHEASALCHLSPAAIHKHLKTLESEFGSRPN
jgi:DNA-binding transcriptional LysR family regulator